jgi:hypothetical protein
LPRSTVTDHDCARGDAPFAGALLESVEVAAGEQRALRRRRGGGLQREEAALDGGAAARIGRLAVQLDQHVAHLVHAAAAGAQRRERALDEAGGQ